MEGISELWLVLVLVLVLVLGWEDSAVCSARDGNGRKGSGCCRVGDVSPLNFLVE